MTCLRKHRDRFSLVFVFCFTFTPNRALDNSKSISFWSTRENRKTHTHTLTLRQGVCSTAFRIINQVKETEYLGYFFYSNRNKKRFKSTKKLF